MRSKLFVPGSRPEFFAKALAGPADALSFDLEDAVTEDRKAEARAAVAELLQSADAVSSPKTLIARINGRSTPHFEADISAVVRPGLSLLNLPKAETPEDVRAVAAAVDAAERANGVTRPVRLLLNIESPQGLRRAAELASADPRVAGLQMGYGDFFEPLGIARRDTANVHAAMFALRMAAGEAGVFAFDSAFADVQDTEGFTAEAEMARRLGYLGKSCIHPSQVPLTHRVFRPADAEIAHAVKVLEAAHAAGERSVGAWMVDGRMVDAPFIRRAEAIVADARALGLLPVS